MLFLYNFSSVIIFEEFEVIYGNALFKTLRIRLVITDRIYANLTDPN